MEIWKKVNGFEDYEISNLGNVVSLKRNKRMSLKKSKDNYGYLVVGLRNVKEKKTLKVHRLVALTFIENPENKETVNHINGIKTDNRVENLEWNTFFENTNHANITGLTDIKGEKHINAVLNEDLVILIRKTYSEGQINKSKISRMLNVNRNTVNDVISNRTWKHI